MCKITLPILYVLFVGTSFAQYIENKDFATRVYLMGNPSFILDDPELSFNNLYAFEGNPADLLNYLENKNYALDAVIPVMYYYGNIGLKLRLRYLMKINRNIGFGLTDREENLLNYFSWYGEERSSNYIFLFNVNIKNFQAGTVTSFYKEPLTYYPDETCWGRLDWHQDISGLYSLFKMKIGIKWRWLHWWLDYPYYMSHTKSSTLSLYYLYNLPSLDFIILYRNYFEREISRILYRDVFGLKGRITVKKKFPSIILRAGLSFDYLNGANSVAYFSTYEQWNCIGGFSVKKWFCTLVAEAVLSKWNQSIGYYDFSDSSKGRMVGCEFDVLPNIKLMAGISNINKTGYARNVEYPRSTDKDYYTIGISYTSSERIILTIGTAMQFSKKNNNWHSNHYPVIHFKVLFK